MAIAHLIRKGRVEPVTKTDSYGVTMLVAWRRKGDSRKAHHNEFVLKVPKPWIDRKAIAEGQALSPGAQIIMDQCKWRVTFGRVNAESDDAFVNGELAIAAQCYFEEPSKRKMIHPVSMTGSFGPEEHPHPVTWPFHPDEWTPGERIRELQIAGALFLAEGERLKRLGNPDDALQVQGLAMGCARLIDDIYQVGPLTPGPWMSEPTSGAEN